MAWLGDGLSSLSNLKGQITNFTKGVLSEGIVEEIDERAKELRDVKERCVRLQEVLNSKDVEISLLRRQNYELQKAVVETSSMSRDEHNVEQNEDDESGFFWDPISSEHRNSKSRQSAHHLQKQLGQAARRIRELEAELQRAQQVDNSPKEEDVPSGHRNVEFLRAKQDMVNRIIQLEEKNREAERNSGPDETTLINEFRTVIGKLRSSEKLDLLRSAFAALQRENGNNENEAFELRKTTSNREKGLGDTLQALEEENVRLLASVEQLDEEHRQAIDELLSVKNEIERKHKCLQSAYEKLYVDFNEAQDTVTKLQEELTDNKSTSQDPRTKLGEHWRNNAEKSRADGSSQTEEYPLSVNESHILAEHERKTRDILRNTCFDPEVGETIFETVARRYVETKWKQDLLEKKVTKLTRDLNETAEAKVFLQMECEDVRAQLDAVLMDIQHSKANLPSIPETEAESLQEEVARLQIENQRLNDLLSSQDGRDHTSRGSATNSIDNLLQTEQNGPKNPMNDLSQGRVEVERLDVLRSELAKMTDRTTDLEKNLRARRAEIEALNDRLLCTDNEMAKLTMENEKLLKENSSLAEQLAVTEDESSGKIELLSTEKTLLEQENSELRRDHAELIEKHERLLDDFSRMTSDKELLDRKAERANELEKELTRIQQEYVEMKTEMERLRLVEKESLEIEKNLAAVSEELRSTSELCVTLETVNQRLLADKEDSALAIVKQREKDEITNILLAEKEKLSQEVGSLRYDNERMGSEMDSLKAEYEKIKNKNESLSNDLRDMEIKLREEELAADVEAEVANDNVRVKLERDELLLLVRTKHEENVQYHAEIQRLSVLLNEANFQHEAAKKEVSLLRERCQNLEAVLAEEQSVNRQLRQRLSEADSKEANAAKELERLRAHLVEIESSYTEEALIAEETRKELETRLLQAEERAQNSSTVYTSASIRANQQVETLQQQLAHVLQQRDDIQHKLCQAEDQILSQTASLTNLQIVLEQFQQDKERDIQTATERLQDQLKGSDDQRDVLSKEISHLKEQLAEARQYVQAASRLGEELDRKTERIEQLNREVRRLTELVDTAEQRINEAKQSNVGKVDKNLMKNLLLGYLSSSASDKSSVLRVFATVLEFNEWEKDKAGLNGAHASNSWFSRPNGGTSEPIKDQETSLSAAFVKFLESESKPKPQLPPLPLSSSILPKQTHSRQSSMSSTQSTLLLPNVTLPTFPDFVPARNTGSILKEVLKDS